MKKLILIAFLLHPSLILCISSASYPFVSEDIFQKLCDHQTDRFNPSAVRNGDTIFVTSNGIDNFFRTKHPHIKAKYILVTHGHWCTIPGTYAHYLDDPKLIAWFTKNMDRHHHKLYPIPIGLTNPTHPQGKIAAVQNSMNTAKPPYKRSSDKLVCINHKLDARSHPNRKKASKCLDGKDFCINTYGKSFPEYMQAMSEFRFVLSPDGLGPDCHRTWEAFYVNTIPIVLHSPLDPLFADLPVLLIDSWDEITKEFLDKKFEEITSKSYNKEKLFADYWINLIRSIQKKHR